MSKKIFFPLGQVVMTPGVQYASTTLERTVFLARHANGDWEDVDAKTPEGWLKIMMNTQAMDIALQAVNAAK